MTFLLSRVDYAKLHLEWIWPIPLIAMGTLIIALALRRDRGDDSS